MKIKALEIKGNQGFIHPTLIWDDHAIVLIDAGYPGQVQEVRSVIEEAGIPFSQLNKVILTHQDFDHIGGLKELLQDHPIEVMAHEEEKPYIEGVKPLLKMTPERLATMFKSLPEEQRPEAEAQFLESLRSNVNKTIGDCEVLPYCGGITVIYTPGHTPGHICLYHNLSKTLITGDALNVVEGQLVGPNPVFTADMSRAWESVRKLTEYDIESVICYHGGVYDDHVNERLIELIEGHQNESV